MNFRKLLYPFSVIYDGITCLRNIAYDKGWKKSKSYPIPVIAVGNLSTGGTGKSPMVEYLIHLLQKEYRVAVLSRGYKRKTKGYQEVKVAHSAEAVGDEPLQFKKKFPEVTIAVCANRQEGIERLLSKAEIIVLDDAFQHRKVIPSFTIVLTSFQELFIDDLVLPAGNLRESKRGITRADVVVVTKCPRDVPHATLQEIQYRMQLQPQQTLYFSKIDYSAFIYGKTETLPLHYLKDKVFTLVTGIANPAPLLSFLKKENFVFTHKKYADHHHFTSSEINELKQEELILTTEKDYMRLQPRMDKFALYYLPITTEIINNQGDSFDAKIIEAVQSFRALRA